MQQQCERVLSIPMIHGVAVRFTCAASLAVPQCPGVQRRFGLSQVYVQCRSITWDHVLTGSDARQAPLKSLPFGHAHTLTGSTGTS